MNPIKVLLFLAAVIALLVITAWPFGQKQPADLAELRREVVDDRPAPVDHAKLAPLQGEFDQPQEVTRACLTCHTERHTEIMASSHWTWDREAYIDGRGITHAGKANLLNNFCIGIGGSETTCTKCHIGYGWTDAGFDFTAEENIDCLVCHDQSDTYVKASGRAGYPTDSVNLGVAARSVGTPRNENCGTCHFYSGGGNNVKHGDLEEALLTADRTVDVHMGYDGGDLDCVVCHETEGHEIPGQLASVSSMNVDRLSCDGCHGDAPHAETILNEHTVKIACQTCHIPTYAKVNATKMTWDWSQAGRLRDGQPYHEEDEDGNHTYLSIKGAFTWGKDVEPEYIWFNGEVDHYFIGDRIDGDVHEGHVVPMNTLHGEYRDESAQIIPVKIHRARQIYDCELQQIIQPKLFAEQPGEGGYWKDFDWDIAARLGMEHVGEDYSGHYCFVNTEMTWPVNHMVSPAEDALTCTECHTPEGGRLAGLNDFYMPGRDRHAGVERIGLAMIVLSLAGVIAHLTVRTLATVTGRKDR